ncbi:MAG: hypothetical protein R3E98_04655 [Gemmatimonadota bacterium]
MIRTAAVLLLLCALPAPARSQRPDEAPAPETAEARARMDRKLDALDEALAATPHDPALHWERLRTLYVLAVAEEARLRDARATLVWLRGSAEPGSDAAHRLDAYEGALEVVRGKHAFWPHDKVGHVRAGLRTLDTAVAEAPDDIEVRNLRLLSTFYLPFFFGRDDTARADLQALSTLLPAHPRALPPEAFGAVVEFVLEHGQLDDHTAHTLRVLHAETLERRSTPGDGGQ